MNPETFSGDQPLGQPAILLSLSPREKGSYPWFPFGTSIGIYSYFTDFHPDCKSYSKEEYVLFLRLF